MKLPRYWRYVVAAVVGLALGALVHGTVGTVLGVAVALTIILVVESRTRPPRRRRD